MTIEEYLIETIDSLDDSLTDEDIIRISEEMSQKLCEYNNYYGNREELNETIYNLLYDYLNQVITKEELIDNINYEIDIFITGVNPLDEFSEDDLFVDESGNIIDDSVIYDDSYSYDASNDNSYYDDTSSTGSYEAPSDYSYSSGSSSTGYSYQSSGSSSSNSSVVNITQPAEGSSYDITVDITIEEMDLAVPKYEEIERVIGESNITANISLSTVQSEINQINTLLGQAKKDMSEYLEKIKKLLVELFDNVAGIDNEIFDPEITSEGIVDGQEEYVTYEPTSPNISFVDISQMTASWKSKSSIQRADSAVFERLGFQVDSNGVVMVNNCEYDTTTGKLVNMDNGKSIYVNYYVPKNLIGNSEQLSMANTITCLSASNEYSVSDNHGYGNIADYKSDAIIVIPSKDGLVDVGRSYTQGLDSVKDATFFATSFAKQKPGCHNIIGGCSTGASSALKAAANYDIYDTAFCINYPALVPGASKDKGFYVDRLDSNEVANLSNKTVLLIESGGDANIKATEESARVLSGSNQNVYYATNAKVTNAGSVHLVNWSSFAQNYSGSKLGVNSNGEYSGHPAYHGLMADVINSGMFNYNNYNTPNNG